MFVCYSAYACQMYSKQSMALKQSWNELHQDMNPSCLLGGYSSHYQNKTPSNMNKINV